MGVLVIIWKTLFDSALITLLLRHLPVGEMEQLIKIFWLDRLGVTLEVSLVLAIPWLNMYGGCIWTLVLLSRVLEVATQGRQLSLRHGILCLLSNA